MATKDDRAAGRSEGRVTLWAVEVFVALAEEGAISAVARRLGVSASGVSQQIAAEQEESGEKNLLEAKNEDPPNSKE